MNFIKILHSQYILQHIEKSPSSCCTAYTWKLIDKNVMMKSRKTPQQKLIFQIDSLNSNTVNEVFFHLTILFLFISLPGSL